MLSLGISCHYHDSAVAVVDEEKILFAAQEERFSRVKGDSRFPFLALRAALDNLEISLRDIDFITYYENARLKRHRIKSTFIKNFPKNLPQIVNFIQNFDTKKYFPIGALEDTFGQSVKYYTHHESHAASTFLPSPFENAAVLVVDGVGEIATSSIFTAKRKFPILELVEQENFPNSLGLFYATLTSYSGFKVNSGEYKFMGLAPYGRPRYVDLIKDHLIYWDESGRVQMNMNYFGFTTKLTMWNQKMVDLLGQPPRLPESRIRNFDCDLAHSTQVVLEEIYLKKARYALKTTKQEKLCIAGGVALNCVANSKLAKLIPIESIFIQPAAGDAGTALGAAMLRITNERNSSNYKYFKLGNSFFGSQYLEDEIEEILRKTKLKFHKMKHEALDEFLADALVDNKSIGWFRGKMEFGPRALGGRSILASATDPSMQKRLNLQIKKRESFRPFAPVVLKELAHEWFDWPRDADSNFMLFTTQVKEGWRKDIIQMHESESDDIDLISQVNEVRSKIPAVTHVDLSARLQTISKDNPLHGLMQKYYARTGIPVLINTSFNVRNEPIVESPIDAIQCFMSTDIDALAIESFLVLKSEQSKELIKYFVDNGFRGELD